MITPSFRCRQDRGFVIVEIYLPSIHCRVSSAEFDITPFQFTFHCNPYYLRLQFQSKAEVKASLTTAPTAASSSHQPQGLCEGKGERATYDVAASTMTVYLPKAVEGEIFLHLDMPNILLATHAQRKAMLAPKLVQVVDSVDNNDDDDGNNDSEKKKNKKTSDGKDDEEGEWEDCDDEDEEGDDDEANLEDELETEFVQMEIKDSNANSGLKPFTCNVNANANNGDDDVETKMAVKLPGTDNSLLALEAKLAADNSDQQQKAGNEVGVTADGWSKEIVDPSIASALDASAQTMNGTNANNGKGSKIIEGYGFNNEFHNVFAVMSATDSKQNTNLVGEVVDVKDPDNKTHLDRRQERLMRETEEYEDEAFWGCINDDPRDPESDLGELFAAIGGMGGGGGGGANSRRFVPWYIAAFEAQLEATGVAFVSTYSNANSAAAAATAGSTTTTTTAAEAAASLLVPSAIPKHGVEEEGEDFGTADAAIAAAGARRGIIVAWEGNTGTVVETRGRAPMPPTATAAVVLPSKNTPPLIPTKAVGDGPVDAVAADERRLPLRTAASDNAPPQPSQRGPLITEVLVGNEKLLPAEARDVTGGGDDDTANEGRHADVSVVSATAAGVVLTSKPIIASTAAVPTAAVATNAVAVPNAPSSAAAPNAPRLAIPSIPPTVVFTKEEAQLLLHIQPRAAPLTPIPSNAGEVCALLVDLLCAFIFDYLTTMGDGSVESAWTVTRLSPALSFLDNPRNVFEALVGFARRVFIYPYVRHWALVQRVARDVGVILLSGPQSVIKALLGLKHILDNTEHHHMLTKLFVNPMIGYLSGCLRNDGDAAAMASSLQRTALQIHSAMTFEPCEALVRGELVPPHVIDMLCDGMDGARDAEEDAAVKKLAGEKAMEDDGADKSSGKGSSALSGGKGLVLRMLNEKKPQQTAAESKKSGMGEATSSSICRNGAIQYEPLAPFTIGLPIDMEDEDDM